MWKKFFAPTPVRIKKILLALKGFIGAIAVSNYFNGNKDVAFWFLVAGAFVDFLLNCTVDKDGTPPAANFFKPALFIIIASVLLTSCKVVKPARENFHSVTDSVITNYKPVDVPVTGASVTDSISPFAWGGISHLLTLDTTTPKLITFNGNLKPFKTPLKRDTVRVTDPQTKVQLKYWFDAYGKLQMQCSSKDTTLQIMMAEITRLHNDVSVEKKSEVVYKMPKWGWVVVGIALFACAVLALETFFKNKWS